MLEGDGTVYPLGLVQHHRDAPVTARATKIAASGDGYWVLEKDGRVHAFGSAPHHGDVSRLPLNGPIIDSIATPSGRGYWQMGSDGGIFASGDAEFFGSIQMFLNQSSPGTAAVDWLNEPIVSIVATPDNDGYWLVGADGGTFGFGAAGYRGSVPGVLPPGSSLNRPVNGMVA
jgi:hypothetical protein